MVLSHQITTTVPSRLVMGMFVWASFRATTLAVGSTERNTGLEEAPRVLGMAKFSGENELTEFTIVIFAWQKFYGLRY